MNNLTLAKISETEAFLEKNASNISKEQWKSILENTELSENFIDKNFDDWCKNAKDGIEAISSYQKLSASFIADHLEKGMDFRDLLCNEKIPHRRLSCMLKAYNASIPSDNDWKLDDYYDKITANIKRACRGPPGMPGLTLRRWSDFFPPGGHGGGTANGNSWRRGAI